MNHNTEIYHLKLAMTLKHELNIIWEIGIRGNTKKKSVMAKPWMYNSIHQGSNNFSGALKSYTWLRISD